MRTYKIQDYLLITQHKPTETKTTIRKNTHFTVMSSAPRNHTSPRWENQQTFRNIVTHEEQERARRQGREVPFLESRLEMLNRHLLDTNHQLRAKLDELHVLQRRYEELRRVNGELMTTRRRLERRNGELSLENDMLRGLSRGGRR
ncbi:hypothetical protein M436DRAFT_73767 [Aureobasidium namibiae CBS 147.97]|uniref:BZIP domain-containing protein n=1 Tax=Aureobasidium namibiae CBS 147.97 TaxID=1043004 RepID=A0A074WG84_9PEZI|nr:uncharacterized protein M436DRAFT_73767 [Aureobasidium namibiae CBS 147.97]KEQ72038.1 hypothetical protein M436DRAFT_73767 [Aureobasidium namibiae CBS 147.97]